MTSLRLTLCRSFNHHQSSPQRPHPQHPTPHTHTKPPPPPPPPPKHTPKKTPLLPDVQRSMLQFKYALLITSLCLRTVVVFGFVFFFFFFFFRWVVWFLVVVFMVFGCFDLKECPKIPPRDPPHLALPFFFFHSRLPRPFRPVCVKRLFSRFPRFGDFY